MVRLLKEIEKHLEFNLVSINGGSKNNSIPREYSAVITINKSEERKLLEIKTIMCEKFKSEFRKKDSDLRGYLLESEEKVKRVFSD